MRFTLAIALLCSVITSLAQVQVKGIASDKDGTRLPSAHVFVYPDSVTTVANQDGQFNVRVRPGKKTIQVTFIGYEVYQLRANVRRDTTLQIYLKPVANQLQEVIVRGMRDLDVAIFESNKTSTHVLTKDHINAIPVLGGEADVIKTLQLLPGTVRGVEGTSDLFVRGGAADQNLVLLDGAPVYNTSHLFGFLSVFNPDILDKVEAINGGFPAQYGGRLSSILDVQSSSTITQRPSVSGDIGLIASRLFVETPIVRDKASVWVSGRRTYIDKVLKVVGEDLPYYFYDFNAKAIVKPSSKDALEFSYYGGNDVLSWYRDRNNDGSGFLSKFKSGNNSQSLRWRRKLASDWTYYQTLFRTKYEYSILNSFEENQLTALSDIEDLGANVMLQKDSLPWNGVLITGIDWTQHRVSPNVVNTVGSIADFRESGASSGQRAQELSAHVQYEFSPVPDWRINAGLRASSAWVRNTTYFFPEPRLSLRYSINEDHAVKLSYSRMAQYIHRISNSAISSPTDIWYPVTDSIKPQSSHQIAMAWQHNMNKHGMYLSVEGYYKTMTQLIGYEEGTNLFLNTDFESSLIQGKGRAYGVEFLLRKNSGKLTGWLSYTLSWAWRQFDEINQGAWFPSRYDRRHNGAVVMQYAINKRISASVVWEYLSGARFTPVIGQYVLLAPTYNGFNLIPVYAGINQVKLSDTHRLDVGLKFTSKPARRFQWHWFVGVYNAYNRASPIGINIEQDENDNSLRYEQPGLFGLLPFISYGFKL